MRIPLMLIFFIVFGYHLVAVLAASENGVPDAIKKYYEYYGFVSMYRHPHAYIESNLRKTADFSVIRHAEIGERVSWLSDRMLEPTQRMPITGSRMLSYDEDWNLLDDGSPDPITDPAIATLRSIRIEESIAYTTIEMYLLAPVHNGTMISVFENAHGRLSEIPLGAEALDYLPELEKRTEVHKWILKDDDWYREAGAFIYVDDSPT